MGTDCTGIWQRQNSSDGSWHDVHNDFEVFRNSVLYGVLALGYSRWDSTPITPIAKIRGIPDDVMEKDVFVSEDSFGRSWLTGEEMLNWYNTPGQLFERGGVENLAYFFDEVKRLVDLYGVIRFVFWFDS